MRYTLYRTKSGIVLLYRTNDICDRDMTPILRSDSHNLMLAVREERFRGREK